MLHLTKDQLNLLINITAILAVLLFLIAAYLLIREIFKNHKDYE